MRDILEGHKKGTIADELISDVLKKVEKVSGENMIKSSSIANSQLIQVTDKLPATSTSALLIGSNIAAEKKSSGSN